MRRLLSLAVGLAVLPVAVAHADCDTHRWLDKVTNSGSTIELDNGSKWQVGEADRSTAERWKQDAQITACEGELINREDHESVRAERTSSGF